MAKVGWTETGKVSFVSGGVIVQYDQVVASGNDIVTVAGSGGQAIGVALNAATATGKDVAVLMYNAGGTVPGVTAATCPAGSSVYTYTSGLVKSTTTAASGTACRIGVCTSGSTVTGARIAFAPGIAPKTT